VRLNEMHSYIEELYQQRFTEIDAITEME